MDTHPKVNAPVVLRDQADREYYTQVTDVGDDLLVVLRPHGLPADAVFDPGTEVSVVWVDPEGSFAVLPTRILSAQTEGTMPLWSLSTIGPVLADQRRRHERLTADGPITLQPIGADESEAVAGSLADVSEGALRCSVNVGLADRFLTGRNAVVAEFRYGSTDFAVPGRVEFLRATSRPAEFEDLVVLFDEPITLDAADGS